TKESVQASRRAAVSQELKVRPHTAQARAFRIPIEFLPLLLLSGIVLLRRIHLRAVAFVVPPCQAEISRDHVCARVHMTDHALRCRNSTGELVEDWMARFTARNVLVAGLRPSQISSPTINLRVGRITIVCIDHVTRRTT